MTMLFDRHGIGGNEPPPLAEILKDNHSALLTGVETLAASAQQMPKQVKSEDDLDAVGVVVKDARAMQKRIDDARTREKAPYLEAGRTVDSFFRAQSDRIEKIVSVLSSRATEYQRAVAAEARRKAEEEARKAREEADRQRRIADEAAEKNRLATAARAADKAEAAEDRAIEAQAAAAASAAELTKVRTASGVTASAKTVWKGEISDLAAVDLEALRPYLKREAIETAINTAVRIGVRDIRGVRIFEDVQATFR